MTSGVESHFRDRSGKRMKASGRNPRYLCLLVLALSNQHAHRQYAIDTGQPMYDRRNGTSAVPTTIVQWSINLKRWNTPTSRKTTPETMR